MRLLSAIATFVLLAALSACEPAPLPFGPSVAVNACGGVVELVGAPGDACGACGGGVLVCDGDTALRCSGDRPNACGACGPLDGVPGDACSPCGAEWVCAGDMVVCIGPEANACGGCDELPGTVGARCGACGETWTCGGDGTLECPDASNACGGCAKLAVAPGDACGECGSGRFECESPDRIRCVSDSGPEVNACGGCAVLEADPGKPCGGCGVWECDGADGVECVEGGVLTCGYPDADGDGFGTGEPTCECGDVGVASRAGDCDDTDPAIHPYCGDGIVHCGDEIGCTFAPDLANAATVQPLVGISTERSLRAPIVADRDLTGDGRVDLAIAMPDRPCADDPSRACGVVAVLDGPIAGAKLGYRAIVAPEDEAERFGTCLAAGDLDGDGLEDLVVVGEDGSGLVVHVFPGPLNPTNSLRPERASTALRPEPALVGDVELLSCHVARSASGGAVLLSFESEIGVVALRADGTVDDVAFEGPRGRRVVTDVVPGADGDRVFVVHHGDDGVYGEVHGEVGLFTPSRALARVSILGVGADPTTRFVAASENLALGSGGRTGASLFELEGDGAPFASVFGLGTAGPEGWPVGGGADLDGDGQVEFVVGVPDAGGAAGRVVWAPVPEPSDDGRIPLSTADLGAIDGAEPGNAMGAWVTMRPDLDGDGHRDLVVLLPGPGESGAATLAIFFARTGA